MKGIVFAVDKEILRRQEIARRYRSEINKSLLILAKVRIQAGHIWHLFVVFCEHREALKSWLSQNDVRTLVHYPIPPHKQMAYSEFHQLSKPIA